MFAPERPTGAYSFLNAGAGVRLIQSQWLHTLTLQARNLNNTAWRDHLSRVKDVVPQPGRNIQIVYRVHF
jgi:iron complex outermembrane recepter protein